ncbi:MAG: leucine-rich repeat domain-containing protein [Gemmatimonadota bacterium]
MLTDRTAGADAVGPACRRPSWLRLAPALACLLLLSACDPGPTSSPEPRPESGDSTPLPDRVVFVDRGLRQAVREAVGKPTGGVTREEAGSLRDLDASSQGIASLAGIAQLPSLTSLDLSFNRIADLRPLEGLARLQLLNLEGNAVRDLAPVAGLTELHTVVLNNNGLTDGSALVHLPSLAYVEIDNNPISRRALLDLVASLRRAGVRVGGRAGADADAEEAASRIGCILDWDEYGLYPGQTLAFDSRRWLYVAASAPSGSGERARLYVSEDRGGFWQQVVQVEDSGTGPTEVAGRFTALWFDASYYSLAFAVRMRGTLSQLLRSYDAGRSWAVVQPLQFTEVRLTDAPYSVRVETAIVPVPGHDATYLVNTGQGLMQTRAGGDWDRSALASQVQARCLLASGGRFVYSLTPEGLLRRAEPDSERWEPRGAVGTAATGRALAMAVAADDGDRLYVAAVDGLYRSADGGRHWTRTLSSGDEPWSALRIRLWPGDPLTVFLLHTAYPSQLWESTDGGVSWRNAGDAFPAATGSHTSARLFYDIAADPLDPFQAYVVLSSGVYRWYR